MNGTWIKDNKGCTAIVFVHGILSSGERCWLNENGTYWPTMLAGESSLSQSGIYVYTYATSVFSGSYSLGDVVDDLKERLAIDKIVNCKQLIFVCHSMGGIVVRKLLVERAVHLAGYDIAIGIFLMASPSLGSSYATFFKVLADALEHSQAKALEFNKNNLWLNELDKQFLNLKESGRILIYGKELIEDKSIFLKKLHLAPIVAPLSGARYFGEPYKVPLSDHFSIAKPSNKSAIQHRMLCQFIKQLETERSARRHEHLPKNNNVDLQRKSANISATLRVTALESLSHLLTTLRTETERMMIEYPIDYQKLVTDGHAPDEAKRRIAAAVRQRIDSIVAGDKLRTQLQLGFPEYSWDLFFAERKVRFREFLNAIHSAASTNQMQSEHEKIAEIRKEYVLHLKKRLDELRLGIYD
jgi:hypothetical protein